MSGVKGGTQHSVVALSTLVTHIITVVLEVLQLEGGAMMFVEDQVQLILLISTHYNNCFIYKWLCRRNKDGLECNMMGRN